MSRTLKCHGLCPWVSVFPFFCKRTMPYNKKLTDLDCLGCTGKYQTVSV